MKRRALQQLAPDQRRVNPLLRNMPQGNLIQGVQNFIKNPQQTLSKLPGIRNQIRSGLLKFGKPVYNTVRTGMDLLGKADKTLEKIEDADIPFLSDVVDMARADPRYKKVIRGAEAGGEALNRGVDILKKIDKYSQMAVDRIS